jgi:sugar diacid utilization regulator
MTAAATGGPDLVIPATATDLALREQLSSLRGLLALSMLMTDRREQEEIVHLATTAVPALVRARPQGVHLTGTEGTRWEAATDACSSAATRADVAAQLRRLPPDGGPLDVRGHVWAWAFALRSLGEPIGHLVVAADQPPSSSDLLLLRSLAQQTGIALANARLHARNRAANEELARTVAALRHKTAIHDRFTQVALTGGGREGIVEALHELTGLPAGIEDRGGELLAWAGPDDARPRRSGSAARRDQVLQRAWRDGHPIRIDDRLLTVARPRADVLGVLVLMDPQGKAGESETVALEHAATVLAIELARLHGVAETELRLGRDLLADLLGGTDEGAHPRAQALGHDLRRPHRVLVISDPRPGAGPDELLLRVRVALGGDRAPLLMQTASTVVALLPTGAGDGASDERLPATVAASVGRGCRVGVGGACASPGEFPRSYRQARLALRLAESGASTGPVVRHDDLGVYRLLAEAADPSSVDEFVRQWIGPLLDYDARRGSELVMTLARHLDCGGNYDATAAVLGLGRSTIRYRLGRIRQLTGHDLADPDVRFQLQFATRAWTTMRALAAQQPAAEVAAVDQDGRRRS